MDNCYYDNSFNIWLSLCQTREWIIDDEKEHPDLLGKYGLGRELDHKWNCNLQLIFDNKRV